MEGEMVWGFDVIFWKSGPLPHLYICRFQKRVGALQPLQKAKLVVIIELSMQCSTLLTEFATALTTILPILFQYCYKYYYSDSRNLWAVMKPGGLTL
jgi:hypothetical protein